MKDRIFGIFIGAVLTIGLMSLFGAAREEVGTYQAITNPPFGEIAILDTRSGHVSTFTLAYETGGFKIDIINGTVEAYGKTNFFKEIEK